MVLASIPIVYVAVSDLFYDNCCFTCFYAFQTTPSALHTIKVNPKYNVLIVLTSVALEGIIETSRQCCTHYFLTRTFLIKSCTEGGRDMSYVQKALQANIQPSIHPSSYTCPWGLSHNTLNKGSGRTLDRSQVHCKLHTLLTLSLKSVGWP